MLGYVYNLSYAINCRISHYIIFSYGGGSIVHALLIYNFCIVHNWGFYGVTWATALMFIARGGIAFGCVKLAGEIPIFPDVYLFSRETVSNLKPLLVLDMKSVSMGIWGTWSLEIFALMSSWLGTSEVGA